jgi:hypothetical protein
MIDIQPSAPQLPHCFGGNTFIGKEKRHVRYSAAEMLSCAR